jgi:hypothetical protein
MLDHEKEAVELIAGKDKKELQHDRILELALILLVEVVGEASAAFTRTILISSLNASIRACKAGMVLGRALKLVDLASPGIYLTFVYVPTK